MGNQLAGEMVDEYDGSIEFCTLGMFIIDEIHFQHPKPPVTNILGGAGSFAALGARIATPAAMSRCISWIVDAGNDFPLELREEIATWGTSCSIRETPERKTTRGWNGYDENEHRTFKYLTPKLRLDEDDLSDDLVRAKSFHLICSATRCTEMVNAINERRRNLEEPLDPPIWVWEPVPDSCIPEELESCKQAAKIVDVTSPNYMELCSLFGLEAHNTKGNVDREKIVECANRLLEIEGSHGRRVPGSIVVRAGKEGSFIFPEKQWVPAYHEDQSKVVDPTGGGNAFLGGLAVTLTRLGFAPQTGILMGAYIGSVAASFAIEQVGIPELSVDNDGETIVNGQNAMGRLIEYVERDGKPQERCTMM